MKTFVACRDQDGNASVFVAENGEERPLPLRLDIVNHSPTGFEWGYGGSGPAQLALAILIEVTGDDRLAYKLHQAFKWDIISRFDSNEWRLNEHDVREWMDLCLVSDE